MLLLSMTLLVCHFIPPSEVRKGIVSLCVAVVAFSICLIIHVHLEILV